jgi:methionyl aminopeptidase
MTEKQYGGQTGRENKATSGNKKTTAEPKKLDPSTSKRNLPKETESKSNGKSSFEKANQIAQEIKTFAKSFIKKDMPLLEIAEKIEDKMVELGGKPAFPTNLSINEIAAHYTPSYDDKRTAEGLLKVDFGIHVNGWTSDNAFSMDLENSEENKKLIESSEKALENASKIFNKEHSFGEIGKTIQDTISSFKFQPIVNLSGHSISEYDLHSGFTVPNYDNKNSEKISKGLYAIEPFATKGIGKVQDGKPSGIYQLIDNKTPRSQTAREVLDFIEDEYSTLPFCQRWIYKKFQARGLFALRELELNGNLHHFAQLVEESKSKVAQTEKTIWID